MKERNSGNLFELGEMAENAVAAASDLGAKREQSGLRGGGDVVHLLRDDEGREEELVDRDARENEMDRGEGELDVGGDDLHFGVGVHLDEDALGFERRREEPPGRPRAS